MRLLPALLVLILSAAAQALDGCPQVRACEIAARITARSPQLRPQPLVLGRQSRTRPAVGHAAGRRVSSPGPFSGGPSFRIFLAAIFRWLLRALTLLFFPLAEGPASGFERALHLGEHQLVCGSEWASQLCDIRGEISPRAACAPCHPLRGVGTAVTSSPLWMTLQPGGRAMQRFAANGATPYPAMHPSGMGLLTLLPPGLPLPPRRLFLLGGETIHGHATRRAPLLGETRGEGGCSRVVHAEHPQLTGHAIALADERWQCEVVSGAQTMHREKQKKPRSHCLVDLKQARPRRHGANRGHQHAKPGQHQWGTGRTRGCLFPA